MKATCLLSKVTDLKDGMKVIARIVPSNVVLMKELSGVCERWFELGIGIWSGGRINGEVFTGDVYTLSGKVQTSTSEYNAIIPPFNDDWGYILDNDLIDKEVEVKLRRVGEKRFFKLVRNDD